MTAMPLVPGLRGKHVYFDYADLFTEEHRYDAAQTTAYCPSPEAPGGYEFKTQWDGLGWKHYSCELVPAFLPRYAHCLIDFLKRRKMDLKVTDVCVPTKA